MDADPITEIPSPAATPQSATPPAPARSVGLFPVLIGVGLAFLAGVLVMGGVAAWWMGWGGQRARLLDTAPPAASTMTAPRTAAPISAPLDANRQAALAASVAELETRLSRIAMDAEGAAGNAGRAEDVMIAAAARRALDNGQPLGYLEQQLRLRFGRAQPKAVATIVNAAREPLTLADLQGGLEAAAASLGGPGSDIGWWGALRQEIGGIVSFRRAGTPSPRPEERLARARRYLAGGRVEAAMAEVVKMPGRAAADGWVQMARRYNEAHRALDLIETAAILEPRELHVAAPPPAPTAAPSLAPGTAAATVAPPPARSAP